MKSEPEVAVAGVSRARPIVSRIVLAITLLAFGGCAGSGRPDWLDDPRAEYPESTHLTGLGSGQTLESAAANATAALAQVFETRVDQVIRDRQALHTGSDAKTRDEQSIESDTRLYTRQVVEGVEITRTWREAGGNYWALAVLDRGPATRSLAGRMQAEERAVASHLARSEQVASPLLRAGALSAALEPARARDVLAAQYRIASGQGWPDRPSTADIESRVADARSKTRVLVEARLVERPGGRESGLPELESALAEEVSRRGFRLAPVDEANASLRARLELSAPFERGGDDWVHHLWELTVELSALDPATRTLLVHRIDGATSHPQAGLARQRAVQDSRARGVPTFVERFDGMLVGRDESDAP